MANKFHQQPRSLAEIPRALIEAEITKRRRRGHDLTEERLSLYDFVKLAWPYVDAQRFLPNWHMGAICDLYEAVSKGQVDRVVVNIAPGLGKSLLSSVLWPAWHWGPFGKPQTRWVVVSYAGESEAPSVRDAMKMRRLIQTDWYQAQWSPVFHFTGDQNAKTYFENNQHGYRISGGFAIAGGKRADILLMDDPINPLEASSLTELQAAIDGFEQSLRSRGNVADRSVIVLIMQRLHELDLSGYLLKQDGWTHMRLPFFYEDFEPCRVFLDGQPFFQDPRTEPDAPIHKGLKFEIARVRRLKKDRPDIFAGQYQQRPVPVEGAQIKLAWLNRWQKLPPVFDDVLISVDCAFKDSEQNSWVVMQCWGRRFAFAYLLDQWRGHWDMPETCAQLQAFAAKWPMAAAKWVEAKANGLGVVQTLKNRTPGVLSTDDDPDILKKFVATSKEAKLAAVAPYFQAGNVFIPENEAFEWVPEYAHELTSFPKGAADDQVDATSLGLYKLMYAIEAFVVAADVVREGEGLGVLRSVFDEAFASSQPGTITETQRDAFGPRHASVTDLLRGGFG